MLRLKESLRPGISASSHLRKGARAVGEALEVLGRYARTVEDRDQQIRMRRVLWIVQVLPSLDLAAATARENLRKRIGIVSVAVGHIASEQSDRMVEHGAVAIGHVLKAVYKLRKDRGV